MRIESRVDEGFLTNSPYLELHRRASIGPEIEHTYGQAHIYPMELHVVVSGTGRYA